MIAYRLTIIDIGNNANTIDEFYYKGMALPAGKKGTGLRGLSREFIKHKKMIDRIFFLSDEGNVLEVTSVFPNKETYEEFVSHEVHKYSIEFFKDRNWQVCRSVFTLTDYKNLKVDMHYDSLKQQ